jgi:hypothetical protein
MARHRVSGIFQVNRILAMLDRQERAFKPHVKFSPAEDKKLRSLVDSIDNVGWNAVADEMDGKNPRQCRERWINYLAPNLKTEPWTADEDSLLMDKYCELGGRWVQITHFFPNRTDCMVKNRFNKLWRRGRKHFNGREPPTIFTPQALTNPGQYRPPKFPGTQLPSVSHRMDQPALPPPQQPHQPPAQLPDSQMHVFDTHDFGSNIWYPEECFETFYIS